MPHAVDVAFQLLGAGAPPVAVVAGLLHDSFAGYVKGARDLLARNIDRKFGSLSKTGSVSSLLNIVAKPDRSEAQVWLERKKKIVGAILETVKQDDMRASPYSPEDVQFMVKAVWSAHNLFLSANPRPSGTAFDVQACGRGRFAARLRRAAKRGCRCRHHARFL
jgi:hypothetical protein